MKKNYLKSCLTLALMFLFLLGCENNLQMILPQGPQGEKGEKGDDGLSAFELWKIYYGKDPNISIEEFFNSLKGKDGKDGAVPYVGENGNWWIDGTDTGIPARGQDGADGKDGVTPVIGENGNWWIDGKDTGVPARGQDGADGFTPYIGENGNWWINGKDTGVPARGQDGQDGQDGETPTVEIGPGPNYYWIINGVTTTISAKGQDGQDGQNGTDGKDGVNGKTAYELWKEALDLCDGTVKNKDGSPYDCTKNSWEDFLKWLQGGDFSVLHQYWLSQGNTGDLNAFLEALFSCHCDGITIIVIAADECVELKSDGSLNKVYNATLKVGGTAGTSVTVTGSDVDANGTIAAGQTEVSFTVPRSDVNKTLTINCTLSGSAEQVTKTAIIPALKYIKLDTSNPVTVTPVTGEEKDVVSITFATAPSEVSVGGTVIYTSSGGTTSGSGWSASNGNMTFTKTYERAATAQSYSVQAKGVNGECSTLNNLFTIPQLTPVDITKEPSLTIYDECSLTLTLEGTPGMTVTAKSTSPALNLVFDETSMDAGKSKYTVTLPRKYTAYSVVVNAEKDGSGTYTKTVSVGASYLMAEPLTIVYSDVDDITIKGSYTNTTNQAVTITFTRSAVVSGVKSRSPWISNTTLTVGPGQTGEVFFYKDYTTTFGTGNYKATIKALNGCNESKTYTKDIPYQKQYGYRFEAIGIVNDDEISFKVIITNSLPSTEVELLLQHSNGLSGGVMKETTDANGNLEKIVTMKIADYNAAVSNGTGSFIFRDGTTTILTSEITFVVVNP